MIDNYPSGMGFFFNLRTLGWEYLVKAVAQHFKTKASLI
jgi:hypothetical protein